MVHQKLATLHPALPPKYKGHLRTHAGNLSTQPSQNTPTHHKVLQLLNVVEAEVQTLQGYQEFLCNMQARKEVKVHT